MCLRFVRRRWFGDKKPLRVGYQILLIQKVNQSLKYSSLFQKYKKEYGVVLNSDYKKELYGFEDCKPYNAGFHFFRYLKEAKLYAEQDLWPGTKAVIVRVIGSDVVAYGKDGRWSAINDAYVSEKIEVLDEVWVSELVKAERKLKKIPILNP